MDKTKLEQIYNHYNNIIHSTGGLGVSQAYNILNYHYNKISAMIDSNERKETTYHKNNIEKYEMFTIDSTELESVITNQLNQEINDTLNKSKKVSPTIIHEEYDVEISNIIPSAPAKKCSDYLGNLIDDGKNGVVLNGVYIDKPDDLNFVKNNDCFTIGSLRLIIHDSDRFKKLIDIGNFQQTWNNIYYQLGQNKEIIEIIPLFTPLITGGALPILTVSSLVVNKIFRIAICVFLICISIYMISLIISQIQKPSTFEYYTPTKQLIFLNRI